MARGKKTSSELKAEVISSKIQNPDLSLRDIEKKTWVSKSTGKDILDNDMQEVRTSSDKITDLVDVNISIMVDWKKVIAKIVSDLADDSKESSVVINGMSDVRSLSSVLEDAFKQNQLLTWWATERQEVIELDTKQRELIAKRYNG